VVALTQRGISRLGEIRGKEFARGVVSAAPISTGHAAQDVGSGAAGSRQVLEGDGAKEGPRVGKPTSYIDEVQRAARDTT